jgi:subtilisin family serine protease
VPFEGCLDEGGIAVRRALSVIVATGVAMVGLLSSIPGGAAEGAASGDRFTEARARTEARPTGKPSLDALRPQWVEGEVLVRWKRGVDRATARSVHAQRGAQVLHRIRDFGGIDVVGLPRGMTVEDGLRSYGRDPRVAVAEPNLIRRWLNHIPAAPNDPQFAQLWGLHNTGQAHVINDPPPATVNGKPDADIDGPEAWVQPHSGTPIVAVVDSGVRTTHEDLVGQFWEDPSNPGVFGRNFGPGNEFDLSDAAPGGGHGTHVAATIAAKANNAKGIAGVCDQCRIMVLKLGAQPTLSAELQAFAFARQHGAHIVNGSFGGGFWSKLERNAIRQMGRAGILAVFAAGNSALDNDLFLAGKGFMSPNFPSSYTLPNILAVAASNDQDEYGHFTGCRLNPNVPKWECAFTNFGAESVDVAAPGVDIRSASRANDTAYVTYNGTSMAAPHVAGIAGLVKSTFPERGHQAIKNAIMRGVDKPTSLGTMYSFIFRPKNAKGRFTRTGGRVNANAALAASTANATPRTDGTIDGAKRARARNRGRVAYPADINDVYKKKLQRGKTYIARLAVPKGKDFDLWVYKPRTTEIHQVEAACFQGRAACRILDVSNREKGKDEVIRFKAKQSGVHFFQVQAWLKHAGRYVFTIRQA